MILFDAFLQTGSNRKPLFSTSDRHLAAEMAAVADRAADGRGEVVMTLVVDGVIENEVPDWKHPDFPRPRCRIPFKEGQSDG